MTPSEFVTWLRGFVAASHHYNLTPAAWEELKAQLAMVANISTTNNE
jgi:truncated hemoglobin YjbI